jgi:hypothetical protein
MQLRRNSLSQSAPVIRMKHLTCEHRMSETKQGRYLVVINVDGTSCAAFAACLGFSWTVGRVEDRPCVEVRQNHLVENLF